jgi:Domain of unknown function (DUF4932)
MRVFCKYGLIIIALTWLACSGGQRKLPENNLLEIRADPTWELFCTIHLLAETGVDEPRDLPKYISAIEAEFESFKDHRAVRTAKRLWETHRINLSALSTLAVFYDSPPGLAPRNSMDPLPSVLDSRWTADVIPEFITAAREFAADAGYMDFFNSQQSFFDLSVQRLAEALDKENMLAWFQDYFGYIPDNYTVIVGMQTGVGNYGASITRRDGSQEFFSIIGGHSPSRRSGVPTFSKKRVIPIVVHEFCHPYINPLIARHSKILEKSGKILFSASEERLARTGTFAWNHMMNEYVVRACVIRYFYSGNQWLAAWRQIRRDRKAGYAAIGDFVDLFEEYEENRDKYPDMDSFMPRIASFFDHYAASL